MGDRNFVIQCFMFLLKMNLFYFVVIAFCILVVCGLVRFIITLKEDDVRISEKHNKKSIRRRKNHRKRT